ncbi:uncharacterized protein TNCV_546031 [Trichonephila clavipes]|nr:uncharacterized protein TNCV_546031 [Trichonephila clavipes]
MLHLLNGNGKINRFILTDTWLRIVFQGFSDTSEAAYGAIVYLQCFHQNDRAKVTTLASKSRVAPMRLIHVTSRSRVEESP